jgi:uncharacterized membrane protein YozB (DUF420 family)
MPQHLNPNQGHPLDRQFYPAISIATLAIVLAGFANTYGSKLIQGAGVATVIHVHAAIFSTWLFAFVIQTLLIFKGKVALHRKVGNAGILLSFMMLVSASITAIAAAREGHLGIPGVEFPTREGFLLLNLSSAIVFAILVTFGWIFRNSPQWHKRFMLIAAVAGLAPPGISRLPFVSGHEPVIGVLVILLISVGPLYDWAMRGRPHRAYLYCLPWVILILPPVVTGLSATPVWRAIASKLIGTDGA